MNLFAKILDFYKTAKISVEELKPLEKFITSEENPKFFFTMTEINKIGINPQSKYNTPLGIYAYPLTKEYYTKLITNTLPFAGDKQYINLFSISDKTNNLSNYNNLEHDVSVLKKYFKDKVSSNISDNLYDIFFNKTKHQAFESAYTFDDVSRFWNLTRILSKTPLKWNSLFRQLGYTNFYDPGKGIIHRAEPTQCVILDPRIIIPIETFLNPYYVAQDPYVQKEISNISEKDINNILKIKNKNTIMKFDKTIFDSLKPYQILYIIENNLLQDKSRIRNNIYIDRDEKLLKHVLKYLTEIPDSYLLNQIYDFALKNGISNIVENEHYLNKGKGLVYSQLSISYFENYELHREDGPAVERINGDKLWIKNGKLHREDGPAIEYYDGSKEWFKNGKLHREDGPAVEDANGNKIWYINNKFHREDGPAKEWGNGTKEWWLNNKCYGYNDKFTNESWKEFVKTI